MGHMLRENISPVIEMDVSGPSFHLCVLVDMSKPLRRVLYVDWEDRERELLLQYEKLLDFCFICGRVDHMVKNYYSPVAVADGVHEFGA